MLWILIKVVIEIGFYAWFFYKSFWALLPLIPVGIYRFRFYGEQLEKKRRREFEVQFQECIMTVSTALKAGYSLENAFVESIGDMKIMFGEKSKIVSELHWVCKGLKNNQSIEKVLAGLSVRGGSNVVSEFADIVKIAVANGGNLTEIIGSTAELMDRERQMREDIRDLVSGKKMEGKIMSLIPFLMVFYVQLGNPGYFNIFYYNATGILIMSVCLAVYMFAVGAIEKILEIVK